jgi:hypothetical protein
MFHYQRVPFWSIHGDGDSGALVLIQSVPRPKVVDWPTHSGAKWWPFQSQWNTIDSHGCHTTAQMKQGICPYIVREGSLFGLIDRGEAHKTKRLIWRYPPFRKPPYGNTMETHILVTDKAAEVSKIGNWRGVLLYVDLMVKSSFKTKSTDLF